MSNEVAHKKLDQMKELIEELEKLLRVPKEKFESNLMAVRAAERNFQLIVDLASDINTQILIERGKKTPDTYRQSFEDLRREGVLEKPLTRELAVSARLRNILVHEYDFEEDYAKFYTSAKTFLPFYREYLKIIFRYFQTKEKS